MFVAHTIHTNQWWYCLHTHQSMVILLAYTLTNGDTACIHQPMVTLLAYTNQWWHWLHTHQPMVILLVYTPTNGDTGCIHQPMKTLLVYMPANSDKTFGIECSYIIGVCSINQQVFQFNFVPTSPYLMKSILLIFQNWAVKIVNSKENRCRMIVWNILESFNMELIIAH